MPGKVKHLSGRRDSNPRRPAWEAGILPLNYSRVLFWLNTKLYSQYFVDLPDFVGHFWDRFLTFTVSRPAGLRVPRSPPCLRDEVNQRAHSVNRNINDSPRRCNAALSRQAALADCWPRFLSLPSRFDTIKRGAAPSLISRASSALLFLRCRCTHALRSRFKK
jgi:hypothetical protein